MKNFKKYKTLFMINWQQSLVSKETFYFWTFIAVLPFLMMFIFWKFVYSTGVSSIHGYTFSILTTYYFVVLIMDRMTNSYVEWLVGEAIRDGEITNFLIQPISLMAHYNIKTLSHRIMYALVFIPVLFVFYFIFNEYLIWPNLLNFGFFLISAAIAYFIFLFLSYLFAFLAFWFEDAEGFFYMKQTLITLLTGALFPLEFLGETALNILKNLPFAYLVYYPVNIYLGKFSEDEIFRIFSFGIIWAIVFYMAAKFMYKKGVKKYSAVGS